MLILRALAKEPMHGYAISHWIVERSGDAIAIEGAALYQALHRLERQRLLTPSWGLSDRNRKAKYYALTASGRARLRTDTSTWRAYAAAVNRVLAPA